MNISDILLFLVLIFLIYNIITHGNYIKIDSNDNLLSNNIVFDDDITIINNNLNENSKKIKDLNTFSEIKENFEDPKEKVNNKLKYQELFTKKNINKTINEIFDMPKKTLDNELKDNNFYLSNDFNSDKIDDSFIPKNESRENNRYNKKYNNIPTELELYNIRKYNLKNSPFSNESIQPHINMNYVNNIVSSTNKNDIDTKIFNKTNKSQKLYKDAKTIAGRFNKDSIINDYKYELDYYQKIKTPWWEENVE